MEQKRKALLILLAALACGVFAAAWFGVWKRGGHTTLTIYGNVDIRTVNLSLRITGRLASLHADEGDSVTAGQVLGELDREPYAIAARVAGADVAAQ